VNKSISWKYSQKNNVRKYYTSINKLKNGCKPRTNLIKDENCDKVAYTYSVLNMWKNHSVGFLICMDLFVRETQVKHQ
jgi:hypothetical protein